MKKLSRLLALILCAALFLAACGRKQDIVDPEVSDSPDTEQSEAADMYEPENLIAADGFDQNPEPTPKPEPELPDEPEPSEEPDEPSMEYGGIPIRNVIAFFNWFVNLPDTTLTEGADPEDAERLKSELAALENEPDDQKVFEWFDKNILKTERDSDTYAGATEEDMEDARNMTIVLMAAFSEYIPNEMSAEDFLGEHGMAVMERWSAKMNQMSENPGIDTPGDIDADPIEPVAVIPESDSEYTQPDADVG